MKEFNAPTGSGQAPGTEGIESAEKKTGECSEVDETNGRESGLFLLMDRIIAS
jgi:hypothetical protein